MNDPAIMSATSINRELDRLDKVQRKIVDHMIRRGRGDETHAQTRDRFARGERDTLTVWFVETGDRKTALYREVARRAGPRMTRLPRGFGPRKDGRT